MKSKTILKMKTLKTKTILKTKTSLKMKTILSSGDAMLVPGCSQEHPELKNKIKLN